MRVLRLTVSYSVLPYGYDENPLRVAVEKALGASWISTNPHGYVEFQLQEPLTAEQQAWLIQAQEQKRFLGWLVQEETSAQAT